MSSYYVATAGDDTDSGTELAPFKTISKLVSSVDTAGDNGFLNRGDTWTSERLAESTDATSGSRILYDAYGSGDLPLLDYNWGNAGNALGVVHITGDYITVSNIRVIKAGPETSGTDSGMVGFRAVSCADPRFVNVEINGAWRAGVQLRNCTVAGVVSGCDLTQCALKRLSGHDRSGIIALTNSAAVTAKNNIVRQNHGEGILINESDDCFIQDNEIFAAWSQGVYIDGGERNIVRRNIVYGTTDTAYHRTTGYVGYGMSINVETFHGPTPLADNEFYLNLVAFTWFGFRLTDQEPTVLQDGLKVEQNTFVDNLFSFSFNYNTPSETDNFFRNNISLPITSGTAHSTGTVRSSGITFDYNYWHGGGEDSNLTGGNDPSGTVTLTKTSGWQSLVTLGDVSGTDFRPSSGLTTIDLGYDDYFGVVDIDEVGAILETDTTPPAVGIGGGTGNPGFPGQYNVRLI